MISCKISIPLILTNISKNLAIKVLFQMIQTYPKNYPNIINLIINQILLICNTNTDYREIIQKDDKLPILINLMKDSPNNYNLILECLINIILKDDECKGSLFSRKGTLFSQIGIDKIIELMQNPNNWTKIEKCWQELANLSKSNNNYDKKLNLIRETGISLIFEIMQTNFSNIENNIKFIINICNSDSDYREIIQKDDKLPILINLMKDSPNNYNLILECLINIILKDDECKGSLFSRKGTLFSQIGIDKIIELMQNPNNWTKIEKCWQELANLSKSNNNYDKKLNLIRETGISLIFEIMQTNFSNIENNIKFIINICNSESDYREIIQKDDKLPILINLMKDSPNNYNLILECLINIILKDEDECKGSLFSRKGTLFSQPGIDKIIELMQNPNYWTKIEKCWQELANINNKFNIIFNI